MGGLFSKGGDNTPPPPVEVPPKPGLDPQMMMMFASMMGGMNAPTPPDQPIIPQVNREPEIDWTEKNKTLAAKLKADYKSDQATKKGRRKTVHTSPLLDGEETTVGGSILTGEDSNSGFFGDTVNKTV